MENMDEKGRQEVNDLLSGPETTRLSRAAIARAVGGDVR